MSYSNDQWRNAVTMLLKLTSKNEIQWEHSDLYKGDAWNYVDESYKAEFREKAYVVSQTKSRYYLDEEEFVWNSGFHLAVYEIKPFEKYEKIATAPEISSLSALFDAAEKSMAFNRNALGDLLK